MDGKPQKIIFDISFTALFKIVGVVLLFVFLYFVRHIIVIFIVSLILSAIIYPFADFFAKKRIPRALAVLLLYIILIGVIGLVITLLIPPLVEQSGQIIKNLSLYWDDFTGRIGLLKNLAITRGLMKDTAGFEAWGESLPKALSGVFSTVSGFFGGLITFILILVLTFYLVVEEGALKKFFRAIAPEKYQPYLVGLISRAQNKIGLWLRGVLTLGLIVGVLAYVGLSILGVKYALVLAILAGLLEVVPYIGPPVSAIPAIFLGFSQAPIKGLLVLILYVIIQQLENNILVPKVMQRAVGLNPVISILSLGIGFKLAGILGALLAIPVATAASVFIADFLELRKKNIS